MATIAGTASNASPHVPVLLEPILAAIAPVAGIWLDGTFGAGGYSRGLLDAGAARVIAVDRDPLAFEMAAGWASLICTLLIVAGVQLFALGMIGEYLGRLFLKDNGSPQYVVRRSYNVREPGGDA